ncbi:ArsR family transcriptional regulator [Methanococcoides methylutens]|uniref:Transcriptional regulator, ArsR family n=1 Tax=Methanococcoides methylutens MM1 TaxID=1434104 RepID=A0A0E3X166_METMT|nr:ArsR family transcriptional regulator [Methanococcoides methylutens]AKB85865.1 transcriptional regulator, ArsR family [Methanococcoides methylutens MM1]
MSQIDNKVFHALGSDTRIRMLELLDESERHISELARELEISVPVAAKHVKILEEADLVERKIFGKTHVLKPNRENIYLAMNVFAPTKSIEVEKGTSLLDALRGVAAVKVKKKGDREVIVSTDGDEGLYVYEINGEFSEKSVQNCIIDEDTTIEWKKLEPVTKIKLDIHVKE